MQKEWHENGRDRCHILRICALSPSGIIGFVFRNRSLFITSGEVGVGVQMIFVVTTKHLHVSPLFFLCVFFDPAIRWWKISWLSPPSSLKATTKNQCYYLLPNPHVHRLKVYNTNLLFVVTIYGFKRYLQKKKQRVCWQLNTKIKDLSDRENSLLRNEN